jgi:hydroxymethylbilane synthase
LNLVTLRGNVDTRLRKLAEGEFDGIILAAAGLKRLGHEKRITQILDDDIMLSAVGQGALGIVCRSNDAATRRTVAVLDHQQTRFAVSAERGLLRALGGSCQVPVAGKSRIEGTHLVIKGLIASLDGTRVIAEEMRGPVDDAVKLGLDLGQKLLSMGAGEILAEIAQYGADR